ncbi:MAG TPA: hypothetical protein VEM13_01975 [Gemmatimonadales bacterium]|nr:hypothetical protein [Gemmatimonadales bacterium]
MRAPLVVRVLPALLLTALASPAAGLPDLRLGRRAGPLTVFPDDRRPDLFYYPPGDLALVADHDQKPDFLFLQLRYTDPTRAASLPTFRNLVSFRVAMAGPTPAELRAAAAALQQRGRVELRPLPITRLEAAVVYAPVGGTPPAAASPPPSPADSGSTAGALPPGHFDAPDSSGSSSATAFWTERAYTIRLDDRTAQLFDRAFHQGQLVLSLGYAFYASGIGPDQPLAQLTGTPELVDALRGRLGPDSTAPHDYLVRASALQITADAARWPDLVQHIDTNQRVPPGYPALEVYCYDFRDNLRDDLYAKQVELSAEGVAGGVVRRTALFSRAQHDLYAHNVRFPFAVRLDRPYRYRVTEILNDGLRVAEPWRVGGPWVELLDLTTITNADSTEGR